MGRGGGGARVSVALAQQVTIVSDVPPLRITALRGGGAPTVTGGFARWTTVTRPRRTSVTAYDGRDPYELLIPILLDGFLTDTSVETDCESLERLAKPARGGDPPLVKIVGFVPHADLEWVLRPPEFVDPVIYHQDGYRTRQAVNVRLLEYVAGDRVGQGNAADRARRDALDQAAAAARKAGVGGAPPAHAKFYIVKADDTLSSIAAHELGDYRRWTEIAALNQGLRDPRHPPVGKRIRLP